MAIKPVSPLNLDRYELKYRIPYSLVEPISRHVEQFCEMDYYSQISHDGFYEINSLYLDSPTLHLYHRKETPEFDYSSFRIRSYGHNPKPPYYFESKQKLGDFCKKRRAKVPFENFEDVILAPWKLKDFDPYADKNMVDFLEKVHTFGLQPTILTQYRRRAYLSTIDDYARVTFDVDMRCQEEKEYNVKPNEGLMSHYDNPDAFRDYGSGRNVILELKCERKIPMWMVNLIQMFQLTRSGYSKYRSSMRETYGQYTIEMAHDLIPHHPENAKLWNSFSRS